MNVELRRYRSSDCREMAELFYETVHTVNRKDYTQAQLDAWADGHVDLKEWDRSFLEHFTVAAVADGVMAGFGDIDRDGYLDRLYVSKDYQGQGVAAALCRCLEQWVCAQHIQEQQKGEGCRVTTHASITARPFFEKRGYRAVKEQQVERRGQKLTNYIMVKDALEEKQ